MRIKTILQWLRSAVNNPREELSKWERVVRYIWDLTRRGTHQLSEDRASMMAASLTYRTLFGLLPVTVVGAGVARTLMGVDRFESSLKGLIQAVALDEVKINTSDDGTVITLGQWLTDIVTSGMNVNIAAMTWIGLLVLVYSAIALLVNIENSFNVIFKEKRGRSWYQRIPLYWFVLTFGLVIAAFALWIDSQVGYLFEEIIPWAGVHWFVIICWNLLVAWISLLMLYRLVPTVKVHARPAMIGALVAAILLLLGKASLGLYFSHAISLQQMYGSLGLVPVFMFWLYLMWLIILLGLQVTAIVQQVSVVPNISDDR